MGFVFGIDLGTTYSCISYVDQYGKPVIVRNREGEFATPSVVLIEKDRRCIVGSTAKGAVNLEPERTVQFIKRKMGIENDTVTIDGEGYKAPEISAMILSKLVKDANDYLIQTGVIQEQNEIKDVVITCPAYFSIPQRNATAEAGKIAGLNVLDIINEPTAAAISYGLSGKSKNETVLVYDLGGGTFDITVMNIDGPDISVVCTAGDDKLGGKDWDEALMNYIIQRYMEEYNEDLSEDPEIIASLYVEVEKWKRTLTDRDSVTVSAIGPTGKRFREEITIDKFNEITIDLLSRTKNLLDDVLATAEKKGFPISRIDKFLLVGGSTYMRQVSDMIETDYHIVPHISDPVEAVAKGAALYAVKQDEFNDFIIHKAEIEGKTVEEVKTELVIVGENDEEYDRYLSSKGKTGLVINIANVLSRTYGMSYFEDRDQKHKRISNMLMINDKLPAITTQSYYTSSNDGTSMDIEVFESLSSDSTMDIDGRTPLTLITMNFVRPLPAFTEIVVTFALDNSGMLHIMAEEQLYHSKLDTTFELNKRMSDSEMKFAISRMGNTIVL